jgi:DinB superfamily
METESDGRADIIELADYVYERTRSRLAGLTDDEYFWEPVPGCRTIRQTESGDYHADAADQPGTPPFTTIAWRLWHLIENYGAQRQPEWLGLERAPGGFEREDPAPPTAAEAMAGLARAYRFWQDLLRELPVASWWERLGPIAGEYAESDKAALVLHCLDEQIHHGAEIGVLRDLYIHDAARSTRADHS